MIKLNTDFTEIFSFFSNASFKMNQKYAKEPGKITYYSQGEKLSDSEFNAKREAIKNALLKKEDIYGIGLSQEEVDTIVNDDDFINFFIESEMDDIFGK
jgi:hypothetical protein